jgi:hypothetical protein
VQASNYLRTLSDLGVRYSEVVQRSASLYLDAVTRSACGEGSLPNTSELYKRYFEYLRRDVPAAYLKVARCGVECMLKSLDASVELANEFNSVVLGPIRQPATQPSADRNMPSADLSFVGDADQTLSQSLVIANKLDRAVSVGFEISEFVADSGGPPVRTKVEVSPSEFELAAGQECVVKCSVLLASEFSPGEPYRAVLRATGFPSMNVTLLALVTESAIAIHPVAAL